ncbi:MAG: M48 family metallopeptidase [Bacteroidia bacterium]|nr:M48 family metallopeptidase [Bacteroidia bacterium]
MSRKILTDLYSYEYEHPFDRESLDRLEHTRGLELLTQKVLDYGFEKYLLIKHTGGNIRVTGKTVPELHNILKEACRIFEITSVPELYIHPEGKITALTSGEKRQIISLSSAAIDALTEDELFFLLGREMGHIRSNHVLYRMMAESLRVVTQLISDVTLGVGNLLSMPIQIALMHWYRMSEFTADRAGLLVCQNPETVSRAFIKMAGLPPKYQGRVSTEDLRLQAADFDGIPETTFDKLIRFAAGYENPEPFTIIRASQLFQWIDSGEYQRILNRSLTKRVEKKGLCPACDTPFTEDENFCHRCGTKLKSAKQSEEN